LCSTTLPRRTVAGFFSVSPLLHRKYRKFGHGSSVFREIDDGIEINYVAINAARERSIIEQATRQVNAVNGDGSKIYGKYLLN
jgi:hypothetical protein